MTTLDDLLQLSAAQVLDRMGRCHPIAPDALDDTEYHGVALAMPWVVEKLAWRTFKKTFHRDGDVLRGWNVAVEQRGPHGPFVDRRRRGERVTYWHYEVHPGAPYAAPTPTSFGLMIDYGKGEKGALNVQRLIRDPLVAVNEGSADLLLGFSFVELGVGRFTAPFTLFALSRGAPLDYVMPRPA